MGERCLNVKTCHSSKVSIEVVFLLAQALSSAAQFAQDQVGALDAVTDSVTEQVLLLPGLQVSVDTVEVAHSKVIRGVGLSALRGQSEPSHGLCLVLSHAEPVQQLLAWISPRVTTGRSNLD